ncbi:MlaD family protein [Nocardioides zeae]|uniref:MCE family protein n=1 Tax=Nocardioides zeae TaxID=1457234 RepID=A0A6P0HH39_9ACTN|nr:MlaD family protein [Nocardioides zeae]NEN77594.1 MCE family protein [Nocardioides zeae]
MITPLIRRQLAAILVTTIVAALALGGFFLRLPETLKLGRYDVAVDLPVGGGIYDGAEVTYLGDPVGRVRDVVLTDSGVRVTLRLVDDVVIPAGVRAEVRSRSAVGEQYVALSPATSTASTTASTAATGASAGDSAPDGERLAEGDVIPVERTTIPVAIGPVLDNVDALARSVDAEDLDTVLDEAAAALQGREGALQDILDDGSSLLAQADAAFEPTELLLTDAEPVLTTVAGESENIAALTAQLADLTGQLRAGDADLRVLLQQGPGSLDQMTGLVDDLGALLPGLLPPLTRVTGVLEVWDQHLASLLAEYPAALRAVQSVTLPALGTHDVRLTLANVNRPAECVEGFLPPSEWASPYDLSVRELAYLYCQAPSDDPRGVRGARNLPCPDDPARREGVAAACLGAEQ